MNIQFISDPSHMGDEITDALESGRYSSFRAAVAYARDSGIVTIEKSLQDFTNNGGKTSVIMGIDQKITSYQSLVSLLAFTDKGRNLFIHHTNQLNETYHPKIYIFSDQSVINKIFVGSSNLTKGGLYTNVEASIGIGFSMTSEKNDAISKFRADVEKFWSGLIKDSNTIQVAKPNQTGIQLLDDLLGQDLLEDELNLGSYRDVVNSALGGKNKTRSSLFGKTNKKHPKNLPSRSAQSPTISDAQATPKQQTFAMTLSHFDTSSKSADPVILVPLVALRANRSFWEFPNKYTQLPGESLQYYEKISTQEKSGKRKDSVSRIYYYGTKKEFRFQCEYVKRNGKKGDIMQIEKLPTEYKVTLIQKGSQEYDVTYKKLTSSAQSHKKFGYF